MRMEDLEANWKMRMEYLEALDAAGLSPNQECVAARATKGQADIDSGLLGLEVGLQVGIKMANEQCARTPWLSRWPNETGRDADVALGSVEAGGDQGRRWRPRGRPTVARLDQKAGIGVGFAQCLKGGSPTSL
jgi:hypothetical protein